MPLRVSDNGRFLVSGRKPFFYLGDTAWELFHRLNREEADTYLADRAARGFTVIQAVVLAEINGLGDPNPYGDLPLTDLDPTRPTEAYFGHVDWIVNRAAALGLHIGMLPTWGDKVFPKWGGGPVIFNQDNATVYGEFLGKRYRRSPIIWILGGDRPAETDKHVAIWRAMAAGLRKGDGGAHRMTYHNMGGRSSSERFHSEPWLDFNMNQSGHGERYGANYAMIERDYARQPTKPCMDGEPNYEDHPVNWNDRNGFFDEADARRAAYWSLFAGAHGHTYGAQPIWQMYAPPRAKVSHVRRTWREALALPGASQMRHAKDLLLSRPFLTRIPDQELLAMDAGAGADHVRATRDSAGAGALVYTPSGKPVSVRLDRIGAARVRVSWFDPRTGKSSAAGTRVSTGVGDFEPPTSGIGQDWVLALDEAR
jgi:hypothetical protein